MKKAIIGSVFLGVLLVLPSLSAARSQNIRTMQSKDSTCIPHQDERTKTCWCVDENGNPTTETCTYVDPYDKTIILKK